MSSNKVAILIVEDDKVFAELLAEAMKERGYRPAIAADAFEAESLVKINSYSAVIIDCMLPKKNGVDLAVTLREGAMPDTPIYFMSGIFRDRTFAADAIKKVNAEMFLHKPFELNELLDVLDQELDPRDEMGKIPLNQLLSKNFSSVRDRRKAIEYLEEISGYDLPLVISVLMKANCSGEFNIATSDGAIFGISLAEGMIVNVDSSQTNEFLAELLIQKGFLPKEDLDHYFENNKSTKLIDGLFEKSLLSPHAASLARLEQMKIEFGSLIKNINMNVNFTATRAKAKPGAYIRYDEFLPLLAEVVENKLDASWLKSFYSQWADHPIRVNSSDFENEPAFNFEIVSQATGLKDKIAEELTLEELNHLLSSSEECLYKAIHFLASGRFILFDEMKRSKDLKKHTQHMQDIYKNIVGQNPLDVFRYFGVSEQFKRSEFDRIYKEFIQSNHPDTLPKSAPPEVRELFESTLKMVSEAYEVVSENGQLDSLKLEYEKRNLKTQLAIDHQADGYLHLIRQGQFQEAYRELKKLYIEHQSKRADLYMIWAHIRLNGDYIPTSEAAQMIQKLEAYSSDFVSDTHYYFIYALVKISQGDFIGGKKYLEKSMQLNPQFLDARREYANLKAKIGKGEGTETFIQEISQVVSNFFKNKKVK